MLRRLVGVGLGLFALASGTSALAAQDQATAFTGARVIPIVGSPIEHGVLLVKGGRIVAVGAVGSVKIPSDARIVDVSGKVLMPGFVDSHSHIGDPNGGDGSAPIQGDVRVLDGINPQNDFIQRAQAGGITTANVMPGSGHLMSGQTAYLKLRDTSTIYGMLYCHDILTEICGGMKQANGTNPRGAPPWPGTRAKEAALIREAYTKARAYRDKIKAAGSDSTKLPSRDLEMEALAQVLDGKRVVHMHTHRADDILTAIRLSQEFGYKLVLHHVSEAWKIIPEIAAAHVPCSIILLDSPGGKLEAQDISARNAFLLDSAGVLVGFHTDDPITDSRWFIRSAALAVRAGMPRDHALYSMTMANARILGLDDRIGSLEAGKDADFIVLSGDPLSVYTHVEQTWVEGRKVFDRTDPKDRAYAVGGFNSIRDGQMGELDDERIDDGEGVQ